MRFNKQTTWIACLLVFIVIAAIVKELVGMWEGFANPTSSGAPGPEGPPGPVGPPGSPGPPGGNFLRQGPMRSAAKTAFFLDASKGVSLQRANYLPPQYWTLIADGPLMNLGANACLRYTPGKGVSTGLCKGASSWTQDKTGRVMTTAEGKSYCLQIDTDDVVGEGYSVNAAPCGETPTTAEQWFFA